MKKKNKTGKPKGNLHNRGMSFSTYLANILMASDKGLSAADRQGATASCHGNRVTVSDNCRCLRNVPA